MSDDIVAEYRPFVDDVGALIDGRTVGLLVVGTTVPDVVDLVPSVRWTDVTDGDLPEGTYIFDLEDGRRLVDVRVGGEPQPIPTQATLEDLSSHDHPLLNAFEHVELLYAGAQDVRAPRFSVNDGVLVLPDEADGQVRRRECRRGEWVYTVHTDGRDPQIREDRLKAPDDDADPLAWVRRAPRPAEEIAATLTQRKLQASMTSTVFSFRTTRTSFRPYQFKPVLKLLQSGSPRMLIADEVGLGKTIEAGLIWTELEARHRADRVLVICPSSLVEKWRQEMDDRFGFELAPLDRERLASMLSHLQAGKPTPRGAWVASIERLRTWDGMEQAINLGLTFDLILVDEAHSMRNSASKSYHLGTTLDSLSEAIVFLSATPLNLGNKDLLNLLQLLKPGEFPELDVLEQRLMPTHFLQRIGASLTTPSISQQQRREWFRQVSATRFGRALQGRPEHAELRRLLGKPALEPADAAVIRRQIAALHGLSAVLTRTRKVDVQEIKTVREPQAIDVELDPREARFVELHEQWCADRARAVDAPMHFATQMPLRLVGSCIPAAAQQVLGQTTSIQDLDSPDHKVTSADLVPPDRILVDAARAVSGIDSKYDRLIAYLRQVVEDGRQVLIFTFSLGTIDYLQQRLIADGLRVAALHGRVPRDARHPIMKDFRNGGYDVLVANRVASEGLDFEFCSVVVNYDLPWNPMEVEQRIGRIDRIGQRSPKVHVVQFNVPGTIETDILLRVLERIGVFRESIGELDPIAIEDFKRLEDIAVDFTLTTKQRRQRATEVAIATQERALSRQDVAEASDSTLSGDYGDIEGLEGDLLKSGRYVGPSELATLVRRWATSHGGRCIQDARTLTLVGNIALAERVEALVATGTRSGREVESTARALRGEQPIFLSLDWSATRDSGPDLLTPTHPLVLAAAQNPRHRQTRFGSLAVRGSVDVRPGCYLAFVVEATWEGQRPAHELWTTAVSADTGRPAPDGVMRQVWSALADGTYGAAPREVPDAGRLGYLIRRAVDGMRERQAKEESVRTDENEALTKTRLETYEVEHENRIAEIDRRIEGLDRTSQGERPGIRRLFEGQRAKALRDIEERRRSVEKASDCHLDVEDVACIWVEVS